MITLKNEIREEAVIAILEYRKTEAYQIVDIVSYLASEVTYLEQEII
ncbi:hypothetical protein BC962_0685 [Gillisia mitskevichiae]|uniref:Uncharacterized protein n=1 Tax=Gillisia mitskevichiae TaxID=270921 RepID=A0A495PYR2_9FLAO|nr:hypothetical protein [Gillisia mitskevichiae]RKS55716.1 hypothetical protein BC962_0685 [Gillisia mitskevichiae]